MEDVTHVFTQAAQIESEDDYLSPLGVEISRDLLEIPYVRYVELTASDLYDELEVTRSPSVVSVRERAEIALRVHGVIESRLGKPLILNSQSYHLQIQMLKNRLTAGS